MAAALPKSRTAIVTGANKGIGLAIVRNLALQYPASPLSSPDPSKPSKPKIPLHIYLTSRDKSRGEAALKTLTEEDAQLKQAKALAKDGGLSTIKHHPLDVANAQSIRDLATFLKKEHPEGIDVVVNNAGIALGGFNADVVRETLHTNYHNTLLATQTFLPLLRPGSSSRLVNIASAIGKLGNRYSDALRQRFLTAKSVDDITNLMDEFTASVDNGKHRENGWPGAAYSTSKTGVIGMTKTIAQADTSGVLINCCCPGWVDTDMTKGKGTRTVDQGAATPVFLALQDLGGVKGEFWEDEKVSSW